MADKNGPDDVDQPTRRAPKPPPHRRQLQRAGTMNEVSMPLAVFQNIPSCTLMRKEKSFESLSDTVTAAPRPESLLTRRDALVPKDKSLFENGDNDCGEKSGVRNDNVFIVPHMQISPGDLHMYNRAITGGGILAELQKATVASQAFYPDDGSRKARQPWILKRLYDWSHRAKSREIQRHIERAHSNPDQEFVDADMKNMLGKRWTDMFPLTDACSALEQKRLQSVWELFYTELTYLYQQLLIVRNVYKEPLKKCQVEGCLLSLEPDLLFNNLDELCQISYSFCKELHSGLVAAKQIRQYAPTSIIVSLFDKFSKGPSTVSAYQAYCINYKATMEYLESIRLKDERFVEFEKICVQDVRCHRLKLEDLLISPLHRITRLPLLLKEICKYTRTPSENAELQRILEQLHECLRSIDDSIQWLHNFERLQQLQTQIFWPPIAELEPRAFIPERKLQQFLKLALNRQFCENLLAHPRRKLIHEGVLLGVEAQKQVEYHAFLFNDMFLLTKIKKAPKQTKLTPRSPSTPRSAEQSVRYVVQRQPVPLDSCVFCDVGPHDLAGSGATLKHAFALIHLTRFYQVISVCTLQANVKEEKDLWIRKFQESIENYESIQLKDMVSCMSLFPTSSAATAGTPTLGADRQTPRRSSSKRSNPARNVSSQTNSVDNADSAGADVFAAPAMNAATLSKVTRQLSQSTSSASSASSATSVLPSVCTPTSTTSATASCRIVYHCSEDVTI